jgi:phosphoserine phosphatase
MRHGFCSVVFDCDSTLVSIEGIDHLAGDDAAAIRALTNQAMAGGIPLERVYGERLARIRPSRAAVADLGEAYVSALIPDAAEVVAALAWLGKEVRIVSGGLLQPILRLAEVLGVEARAVAAVGIRFSFDGKYEGYDDESPLARSGGKSEVIRRWALPRPSLLVGDGATDLEAQAEVDAFAAFTAVERREAVAAAADVVLAGLSLAPVLALAATPDDRLRLKRSRWGSLLDRGDRALALAAAGSS